MTKSLLLLRLTSSSAERFKKLVISFWKENRVKFPRLIWESLYTPLCVWRLYPCCWWCEMCFPSGLHASFYLFIFFLWKSFHFFLVCWFHWIFWRAFNFSRVFENSKVFASVRRKFATGKKCGRAADINTRNRSSERRKRNGPWNFQEYSHSGFLENGECILRLYTAFLNEVQLCTRNYDDFTIKMLIVCFIWRFEISLQ